MDCKEFSNLLDAYMDGALPEADARRMRDHAAECEACAALLSLRQDCRRLDEEIQVPDSFSSTWRQTIREEEKMEEKSKKAVNWKAWVSIAAALIFVVGGTLASRDDLPSRRKTTASYGSSYYAEQTLAAPSSASYKSMAAGGATNADYDRAYSAMEDTADMEAAAEYYDEGTNAAAQSEKIIRSASFTVKTTDYDADLQRIQDLTAELGGRVEYLSSSGDASSGQTRSASLTLRIPSRRLDEFLSGAQGIGAITGMTQEMEDVSDSYYDTQTRLETQRAKLARLQALMEQAEDVSDLIEIESAIADTQYYIDRYTGTLKSYDSKVEYSTVRVAVREIRITETKEVSLGERILTGIGDSLQDFGWFMEDMIIFLASALPWLIALAAVVFVVVLLIRRIKNKKNRKEKKDKEP